MFIQISVFEQFRLDFSIIKIISFFIFLTLRLLEVGDSWIGFELSESL